MGNLEISVLIIILMCNVLMFFLCISQIPKGMRRVYFVFSTVPIFFYSGLGIAFDTIENDYLGKYILFSSVFMITLSFVLKKRITLMNEKKISENLELVTLHESSLSIHEYEIKNKWIFNIGTFIFFMTLFIFLIIPEIRVHQLWSPPTSLVKDIVGRREAIKSNTILNIALMLNTVFLPFFMVKLWDLKQNKRRLSMLALVGLWVYLEFLQEAYLGRYEMILYSMFVFLILTLNTKERFDISKKQISLILTAIVISVPYLLTYQYSRIGMSMTNFSFADAIVELMTIEVLFPKYYPETSYLSSAISPISYLLWILILPIPSFIFPDKSQLGVLINQQFSTFILGVDYGSDDYYGLLPSILGEGILIYGDYFYWIHAVFLATFIGFLCKVMERKPELIILSLFFAIKTITIARGGTQGYIGLVVNSLFIYFLMEFLIINWRKSVKGKFFV